MRAIQKKSIYARPVRVTRHLLAANYSCHCVIAPTKMALRAASGRLSRVSEDPSPADLGHLRR